MGQTPSSSDPFARRVAPEASGIAVPGGRPDRFKLKAERAVAKKAAPAKIELPKADKPKDAFAVQKTAPRPDPFARQQPQAGVGGFASPAAVTPPPPKVAEPARTGLHVVASQQAFASLPSEPVEVKYQDLKREEVRRARIGKSSSLVLVAGSAVAAAEVEAPPAPATVDKPPPPPASATTAPPLVIPSPKPKPGGGGGGGSGGGGKAAAPMRERSFTQDDLVGVVFGVAVLALLLLWLMRPKEGAQENGLFGAQFAANEPVTTAAAPAPPPAPLVDPFGDAPVNLKPTGPIPEPSIEEPSVAVAPPPAPATPAPVTAAPTPASSTPARAAVPPVAIADRRMNAWFCTKSSGMTTASQAALEKEMATFKAAFAGKELVVLGYADTRGTSVYNSALAGERANVVADFLRTNGLTVVDARGIGELDGLDDNQNCANQRRVDVFIKGGPGETPSRACAPEPDVQELACG